MEVVLLWLDDLDDLVFSLALSWERLRRGLLQLGLTAALGVVVCELSMLATEVIPALTVAAAGSVAAWFASWLLRALYYRELSLSPFTA